MRGLPFGLVDGLGTIRGFFFGVVFLTVACLPGCLRVRVCDVSPVKIGPLLQSCAFLLRTAGRGATRFVVLAGFWAGRFAGRRGLVARFGLVCTLLRGMTFFSFLFLLGQDGAAGAFGPDLGVFLIRLSRLELGHALVLA